MTLEIDLLGRFAVRRGGQSVPDAAFGGQLPRRLVRLLVLRRGEIVTRETLIDALWGGHPPADPESNLNVLVNRARRGLGDPGVIQTVAGGYLCISGVGLSIDAEWFEVHLLAARQASAPESTLEAVRSALSLWRGEPLPEDTYAEWAQPHRDRLGRAHQEVLEIGADAALRAGKTALAADLAAEAVARHPLREAAHLLQVRARAATGDTAGALEAYGTLRRQLAEELGIDPSREAADLHRRLLQGRLDGGSGVMAAASEVAAAVRATPFVGRQRELAGLATLDAGHVALVVGESGSGKSRLLREVARRSPRPVLAARAVLPERDAPWSLARTLMRAAIAAGATPAALLSQRSHAAIADLLPELEQDGASSALDAQSRRALALEAGCSLISAVRQSLVVVDDLQWADASSLDLLGLVSSRAAEVSIVLAYRPEEIAASQPVAAFLADLRTMTDPVTIELPALDAAAIRPLVEDEDLASLLADATDGTPFAIMEVVHTLERLGTLQRHGDVWRPVGPAVMDRAREQALAGQRRSVLVRADRQPRVGRELLGLLALLGRPASAQLLARATGLPAPTLNAQLNGLARAHLLSHDPRGWSVSHDLVGETLQDRLDPADRAGLHLMLARALDGTDGGVGERARHLAGAGERPAAADAYVTAAREQLERFADHEAGRLAQAGLDLEPADPIRAQLLEIRAETRVRAGETTGARQDLRLALTLLSRAPERSRLLARLAGLATGVEGLARASSLADLALAEAGEDPAARARALAVAAIVDMNLERPHQAEARYAEALATFQRLGDARGVADVLDARAMATFLDGDIAGGIDAFDQVAGLFADLGDLLRVITPRSTRGHGLVFSGQAHAGLTDADEAVALARSLGNPEGHAYALWHRSEALTACGRLGEAVVAASEGLDIAEGLGHRGWTSTALRAAGLAHEAEGDLDAAEGAFRRCLAVGGHLPLFASWGCARLAMVLIAVGRLDEVDALVAQALAVGPPLGHYEARLARCALAVARGERQLDALLADAADRAAKGGHRASLEPLRTLRDRTVA